VRVSDGLKAQVEPRGDFLQTVQKNMEGYVDRRHVQIPDLLKVQIEPYRRFLQKDVDPEKRENMGLEEVLRKVFPETELFPGEKHYMISSDDRSLFLEYINYTIEDPVESEVECIEKGITYGGRFKVKFRLYKKDKINNRVESVREGQDVYLGLIPLMTERGTFIINGIERAVVNQIQRSPGVYFKEEEEIGQKATYSARIFPARGLWMEFHPELHHNTTCLYAYFGKRKVYATTLLKALGYTDEEIISLFYESPDRMPADSIIKTTLEKDAEIKTQEEAIKKIYLELRPGFPMEEREARSFFKRLFFTSDQYDLSPAGRLQINKKLGLTLKELHLTTEDIVRTLKYLLDLIERGKGETDDIDHLGNKRVRTSAELVKEHIYEGLIRLVHFVKEKMAIIDKTGPIVPQDILNSRIFSTAVEEFFARNQLSQFLDQINPLAELTHKRRLTAVGEGGVKERKRAGFEVRDVHYTHFGRVCPIETPEGANVGLINSLTVYADVDNNGFIRTPYYRVKNGKVLFDEAVYVSADEEDNYVVAPPDVPYDPETGIIKQEIIRVRSKGGEFTEATKDQIELIGISPKQIVGLSASLIPFLEHNDSNRALMGSNMQRQAVPLLRTERPLVRTGIEKRVVMDSGVILRAKNSGTVEYVDAKTIIIDRDEKGIFPWQHKDVYHLQTFRRTNQDTCFHQRPLVSPGQKVKKGQIISDGPAVSPEGDLALGRNLLVAFMPWQGYNFEDAIILSEKLVKEDTFTSIHIEKFEVTAQETERGPEEITSDLPNASEEELRNLDKNGIIRVGAEVKPGDIFVGKITPKGEAELTPEEKLLRVIFGEKARDVANTSLIVPPGVSGVVINVKTYYPADKIPEESIKVQIEKIEKDLAEKKKIVRTIITGRIKDTLSARRIPSTRLTTSIESWDRIVRSIDNNSVKEEIKKIVEIGITELEKLEKEASNEKIKVRRGSELEPNVICKVLVEIATKKKVAIGDKMSGRHGNKGVISVVLPEEDMPFLEDGTPVDIVLNPLGVPSRMNIGQILETHLGWALKTLGYSAETPVFESIKEFEIKQNLREAGLPEDGKTRIYDGQTGEPFLQPVTVGSIYMMKLIHLADEKFHARSVGSYSLITQQPLGGRAQFGGQRFGEMEVWALEGYGAGYTLREMLTIKSDDIKGRKKAYESIVKGLDYQEENLPESFHVLTKELNGLGFDLRIEKKKKNNEDRDVVTIRIAPPMVIRSWSYGEVKKAETLNYRTNKPERDGLFCEKIFGPVKDWECSCGKFKKQRFRGIICDRCGVEVTTSDVRRERMGHIELATPVSYVWMFKSSANWLGVLLDLTQVMLEKVLYYDRYIVIDPGDTPLDEKELLTEEQYRENLAKYGNRFHADIGASAIYELLKKIDLEKEMAKVKDRLKGSKKKKEHTSRRNLVKKLRMIEGLMKTEVKPEYLVTSIIPVIPPDLRPLLPLDGGRFVASDLNDLYQRVINRNNRLRKLIKLQAPDIIIRNEKRMLQEAVDALMDNGRYGTPVLGRGKRPLKSLSEALRGKQGRFRQNLLGKRVDYSGRAVIVVDPKLKLHQCGLPKQMALELFSPFVLRELRKKEYFHTLGSAKRALEENRPEVWEILEKVTRNHPVLLNRQPTLHRLSIQAFDPRLMEGNVLRIHPLVCTAFNADFDGDTMSVHVPITVEAQFEADLLMKSSLHILSPANGRPIVTPTRDIVLGCYYLTFQSEQSVYGGDTSKDSKNREKAKEAIYSFDEAKILYENGLLELHRPVRVRNNKGEIIITTVGRILFNEILPEEIPYQNRLINIEALEHIVKKILIECGYFRTVQFLDEVKELGFTYATRGGLSIGVDDLKIPESKEKVIEETKKEVMRIEKDYRKGLISEGERYNRIIDLWTSVTNRISNDVFETLRKDTSLEPFRINSLIMMVESGARGNRSQVNQLAGMRGLMIRPTKKATGEMGEIITTPVIANFREGLPLLEYFISIHGGRKGVVDTALKTSDAGYLSRRLVDVAHSVIVTMEDCGTADGIYISALTDGEKVIIPLKDRVVGRVAFDPIVDIITDEVLVRAGELIDEEKAEKIAALGVERIKIRSVLTCKAERGVCAKCYGADLSRQKLVNFGEAVGVVAAQSIGEPGTQLTLRTFHVGGTVTRAIGPARIVAHSDGVVRYSENLRVVKNRENKIVVLSREGTIDIEDERGRLLESNAVFVGTILHVEQGKKVKKDQVLATWDPYAVQILAEKEGFVRYKDINNKTVKEEFDASAKVTKRTIIEHQDELEPEIEILEKIYANKNGKIKIEKEYEEKQENIKDEKEKKEEKISILITDTGGQIVQKITVPTHTHTEIIVKEGDRVKKGDIIAQKIVGFHYLAVNTSILVEDGQNVLPGDIIAKTPRVVGRVQDITGGLPRVSELFEARPPRNPAILSEIEGTVSLHSGEKGTRIIRITSETGQVKEYRVPYGKHLLVSNGDHVVSGTKLTDGPVVLTDILRTQGEKKVQEYLLNEIQKVYKVEGVNINDKHMEIIIRQMLSRVRVTDPGDTYLLEGEEVDRMRIQQINESLPRGKKRATYEPLILGITRVALSSESFISAASFQETLKVITNAAVTGAEDYLEGLKENVILGKLIPAGTGFFSNKVREQEQTTQVAVGGE